MFQQAFLDSIKKYSEDNYQQQTFWYEIDSCYSQSHRHYHTMSHLNSLLHELTPYKNKFTNWDSVVFAIGYHDIVYNTLKSNNEEKSAQWAVRRLNEIAFPIDQLKQCKQLILATKSHEPADDETNLFTDADLSILGADEVTYRNYSLQIRREYSLYPDIMYKPGRKKVLKHFLSMETIYKTKEFAERYEHQSRINLMNELQWLTDGQILNE
jgi:predicted metal-dependent HD superfamily phosphohydrolase